MITKVIRNYLEIRSVEELNYSNLSTDSDIAKISVVGMGMMSQSGVAEKMFTTLAKNKINFKQYQLQK